MVTNKLNLFSEVKIEDKFVISIKTKDLSPIAKYYESIISSNENGELLVKRFNDIKDAFRFHKKTVKSFSDCNSKIYRDILSLLLKERIW